MAISLDSLVAFEHLTKRLHRGASGQANVQPVLVEADGKVGGRWTCFGIVEDFIIVQIHADPRSGLS